MRLPTWILATALALGAPRAALAQQTGADHAAAEAQFKQGRDAMSQGNYKRALEQFRGSNDVEPGRGKLLNIAICEEKLGMIAAAMRHFEDLWSELPSGDDRRPIVRRYLTRLEPKVGRLRIDIVPTAPRSTVVLFDGMPVATTSLGRPMAVDPGKHVLTVNADGRPKREYDTSVEAGASTSIRVAPSDAPAGAAGPDGPAIQPGPEVHVTSNRRIAGYVVGGVGLASITVGIATGALSLSKHAEATDECPTHVHCGLGVMEAASTGKALSAASTITLAVGLAATTVGLVLVLTGGDDRPKSSVGLGALPGGGGVTFRSAF